MSLKVGLYADCLIPSSRTGSMGKGETLKTWRQTRVIWRCEGWATDFIRPRAIPGIGKNDYFRLAHELIIVSEMSRKCHVIFLINGPFDEGWLLRERLLEEFAPRKIKLKDRCRGGGFFLVLSLLKGEQFCDATITIAKGVFKVLGINDPDNSKIASFSTQQETFVLYDGKWKTFDDYLRIKHNFRARCVHTR